MEQNETALLAELMLQSELFCSSVESCAADLARSEGDELRLKIGQARGALATLQQKYESESLRLDDALVRATFRQLIISLLWVAFGARVGDRRLYRKLVQIESGFTYLLVIHYGANAEPPTT